MRILLTLLLAALLLARPACPWPDDFAARAEEGAAPAPSAWTAKRDGGKVDTEEVAIRSLRERIAAEPDKPELHALLGRAYLEKNRGLEALAAFTAYFDKGGDDVELLKLCGQLCTWNSRPLDALPWFDKYLLRRPDDADVLKLAAQLRVWNDRQIDALPYLDRYLSHRTDDVEMIRLTGRVNLWNGRQDAAIPYFNRLLVTAPEDTATVKLVGQLHLWNGRARDAVPLFLKLHALLPDDTEPVRLIGEAYLADKRPKEALPWFKRRLASDPRDSVAVRLVGEALLADKRPEEALSLFKRLAALDPAGTRPVKLVADALVAGDRPLEAVEWYKKLRRMDPGDQAAFRMIGCLYAWNGRPAEALPWLQRYNRAHRDPLTAVLEAQSLSGVGRKEEALAKYEGLLRRFPAPDEEGRRTIAGALLYEDAPLADRATLAYGKGASAGLKFFLAGVRLRLFAGLKYREETERAVGELLRTHEILPRPHERFADDVDRAVSALCDAGCATTAVELARAALARKGKPEGAEPILRFALERARHKAHGQAEPLLACRDLALLPEPPRDAGLYYAENETDEAALDAFLARYAGPDAKREGILARRFRRLVDRGERDAARDVALKLPEGIERARAFMTLDTAEVAHPRALLLLDPYDGEAFGRARALLAADAAALAALSDEVALLKERRERENIARLRRRLGHFPDPAEATCDLAKALYWGRARTEAVELLDARLAAVPGDELPLVWRYRFALPEMKSLDEAGLSFLRAAHAKGLFEPLELSGALVKAGRVDEAAELVEAEAERAPGDRRVLREAVSLHMKRRKNRRALDRIRDYLARFGRDEGITLDEAECHLRRKDATAAARALRHLPDRLEGWSANYADYLRRTAERESSFSLHTRADYSVDSERLARRMRSLEARLPFSRGKWLLELDSPRVDRSLGASKSIEVKRFGLLHETERDQFRALVALLGHDGGDTVRANFDWRRGERIELHMRNEVSGDTPEGLAQGIHQRVTGGSGSYTLHPLKLSWRYDRIDVSDGNRGTERGLALALTPWRNAPIRLTLTDSVVGFDRTGLATYYAPERKRTRAYGFTWSPRFLPLYVAWRHYLESNGNEGSSVYGVLPVSWRGVKFNLESSYSEAKSGRFEARRYHSKYVGITLDKIF